MQVEKVMIYYESFCASCDRAMILARAEKNFWKKSSFWFAKRPERWYIRKPLRGLVRRRCGLIENWIVRCKPENSIEIKISINAWIGFSDKIVYYFTESLILAQNERWRHGLGMQVERTPSGVSSERVRNAWAICPQVGNNIRKLMLIPNVVFWSHDLKTKGLPLEDELASH